MSCDHTPTALMQQLGQLTIGTTTAPQCAADLEWQQWCMSGREDSVSSASPAVERVLGQRRLCAAAGPRVTTTAVERHHPLGRAAPSDKVLNDRCRLADSDAVTRGPAWQGRPFSCRHADAISWLSSHASTTDLFQTRRLPSLKLAGPWPMCAQ